MNSMLIGELRVSATFQKLTTLLHRRFLYIKSVLQVDWIRRSRNRSIPETSMLRMMRQHQADALSGISTFRDSGSGRPPKLDAISEAISELFRSVAEIKKRPTGLNLSQSCLRRLSRLQNPGIEEVQEEYRFGRESWSAKNKRKDRC